MNFSQLSPTAMYLIYKLEYIQLSMQKFGLVREVEDLIQVIYTNIWKHI